MYCNYFLYKLYIRLYYSNFQEYAYERYSKVEIPGIFPI